MNIASAFILLLAIALAVFAARDARVAARAYLHFAAVLYCALALADGAAAFVPVAALFAATIAMLVCALAPVALALALFSALEHPPGVWAATVFLCLGLLGGIAAVFFGIAPLAFGLPVAGAFAMLALSFRHLSGNIIAVRRALVAALSLIAGAAVILTDDAIAQTALALFSAVSILGVALASMRRSDAPVAQARRRQRPKIAVSGQG